MHTPNDITLEHIDPRKSPLVSGLTNDPNEILATRSYNSHKNNWFVPYRVCDYPAPVTFGELGEFLIQGYWCVVEFGGEWWMNEAKRLMSIHHPRPHAISTEEWISRIETKEEELGVHIIVCSPNGIITSKSRCSKSCSHHVTRDGLSQILGGKSCCRKGRDFSYVGELVTCPYCGKIGGSLGMSLHVKVCSQRCTS